MGGWDELEKFEQESVKLTFATFLSKEEFEEEFVKPIQEQFPYIQLAYVRAVSRGLPDTSEVYASDIRHFALGGAYSRIGYQMEPSFSAYDLQGRIDSSPLEDSIDNVLWSQVKAIGESGQITALPYSEVLSGLYFDKALFDQFHLSYPYNGMTWSEILDVMRTLPPNDAKNNMGLLTSLLWIDMANQLNIPFVKHEEDNTEDAKSKWSPIVSWFSDAAPIMRQWSGDKLFIIPSSINLSASIPNRHYIGVGFLQGGDSDGLNNRNEVNLDVVSFPVFGQLPTAGPKWVDEGIQIHVDSEHKEDAWKVISLLLSRDHQLRNSKMGIVPVLSDMSLLTEFADELPELTEKNVHNYFYNQYPSYTEGQIMDQRTVDTFQSTVSSALSELSKGLIDKETALTQIVGAYQVFIR